MNCKLKIVLCLVLGHFCLSAKADQDGCVRKNHGDDSVVCVCTANHCDTLPRPQKLNNSSVYIKYTSDRAGLRFKEVQGEFQQSEQINNDIRNVVYINRSLEYQEILGWGGAFSDATGINIASVSEQVQKHLLESYFGENSIEFSLCRVPIGCTDFSPRGYSYVDTEGDVNLTSFALQEEDLLYKIPYIQQALRLTNDELKLFGSPWTSPQWMKTVPKWAGNGKIKDELLPSWAKYFERFIDEYNKRGIDIWGVTTGNEPSLTMWPGQTTPTVGWESAAMQVFIRDHLGPTLRSSNYSDVKIIALDDQRGYLPTLEEIMADAETESYVDGVGVHWYQDWYKPASLLNDAHDKYPDKFILNTEACEGSFFLDKITQTNMKLGSWSRAESFAYDILEDINHWVAGWISWNMALNLQGGPTYTSNFVDAGIIVNATSDEFYKQPMYYAQGHFSKFVSVGSKRVYSSTLDNSSLAVYYSAFKRPDDGIVLVVLNRESSVVPFNIVDGSRLISEYLPANSIATFLYWTD